MTQWIDARKYTVLVVATQAFIEVDLERAFFFCSGSAMEQTASEIGSALLPLDPAWFTQLWNVKSCIISIESENC